MKELTLIEIFLVIFCFLICAIQFAVQKWMKNMADWQKQQDDFLMATANAVIEMDKTSQAKAVKLIQSIREAAKK